MLNSCQEDFSLKQTPFFYLKIPQYMTRIMRNKKICSEKLFRFYLPHAGELYQRMSHQVTVSLDKLQGFTLMCEAL